MEALKELETVFKSGNKISIEGTLGNNPYLSFELKSIDSGFKLSGSFRSGDQLSFTVWKGEEMRNWDIKTPPFDHSTFELTLDGVDNGIEVLSGAFELTYLKYGLYPLTDNLRTLFISGSDFTVTQLKIVQ